MQTPDERARRAIELLSDPLLVEIISKAKARAVSEWAACENPLDRDCCHAKYNAVNTLTRDLLREVETQSTAEVRAGDKGYFYNAYHQLKEIFK